MLGVSLALPGQKAPRGHRVSREKQVYKVRKAFRVSKDRKVRRV
jgi:hypothetical protein